MIGLRRSRRPYRSEQLIAGALEKIQAHASVEAELDLFWQVCVAADPRDQSGISGAETISYPVYEQLYVRLCKVLVSGDEYDGAQAQVAARFDWDALGAEGHESRLEKAPFVNGMFELCYLWTAIECTDERFNFIVEDYTEFLREMNARVTPPTESGHTASLEAGQVGAWRDLASVESCVTDGHARLGHLDLFDFDFETGRDPESAADPVESTPDPAVATEHLANLPSEPSVEWEVVSPTAEMGQKKKNRSQKRPVLPATKPAYAASHADTRCAPALVLAPGKSRGTTPPVSLAGVIEGEEKSAGLPSYVVDNPVSMRTLYTGEIDMIMQRRRRQREKRQSRSVMLQNRFLASLDSVQIGRALAKRTLSIEWTTELREWIALRPVGSAAATVFYLRYVLGLEDAWGAEPLALLSVVEQGSLLLHAICRVSRRGVWLAAELGARAGVGVARTTDQQFVAKLGLAEGGADGEHETNREGLEPEKLMAERLRRLPPQQLALRLIEEFDKLEMHIAVRSQWHS
jgi:hypothetical protein